MLDHKLEFPHQQFNHLEFMMLNIVNWWYIGNALDRPFWVGQKLCRLCLKQSRYLYLSPFIGFVGSPLPPLPRRRCLWMARHYSTARTYPIGLDLNPLQVVKWDMKKGQVRENVWFSCCQRLPLMYAYAYDLEVLLYCTAALLCVRPLLMHQTSKAYA